MPAFWQGVLIGLSVAAPVGPISILVIHRALTQGWRMGMISSLGASVANMLYGALAGLGLGLVAPLMAAYARAIGFVGALLVAIIGARLLVQRPAAQSGTPPPARPLVVFGATLSLTLANPVALLLFAAMLTSARLTGIDHGATVLWFVGGIFVGSMLWWFVLCSAVILAQRELHLNHGARINRAAGVALLGLAVLMAVRAAAG
jgi:threonine/homoserine/homoserine lactone efflux protein